MNSLVISFRTNPQDLATALLYNIHIEQQNPLSIQTHLKKGTIASTGFANYTNLIRQQHPQIAQLVQTPQHAMEVLSMSGIDITPNIQKQKFHNEISQALQIVTNNTHNTQIIDTPTSETSSQLLSSQEQKEIKEAVKKAKNSQTLTEQTSQIPPAKESKPLTEEQIEKFAQQTTKQNTQHEIAGPIPGTIKPA